MAPGPPASTSPHIAGKDPMQLAHYPLAVPYLLNPVGIVSLITISAEAKSISVFAMDLGILAIILLIDAVMFHWANRVRFSEDRMLVTEKIFAFLIAAIAVQLVFNGLASLGVITVVPHLKHWHAGGSCKDPTRLQPDGDPPPVRHQGPMRAQDDEHRSTNCLVDVHANRPLILPLRRMDRQQSVRWGKGRRTKTASRAGTCPARTRRTDDSNGDSNSSSQRLPAATGDSA
jgi:MarC family integral membrane protein